MHKLIALTISKERQAPALSLPPTRFELRLSNALHNLGVVRSVIGKRPLLMAIVKGNCYGHGLVEMAKFYEQTRVNYFGVAKIGEAAQLRGALIKTPILVLESLQPEQACVVIENGLTPSVESIEAASTLNAEAERKGIIVPIHIKIDTGLNLDGALPKDAISLFLALTQLNNIFIEGIYSHFSRADSCEEYCIKQLDTFRNLLDSISELGFNIPIVHMCNSRALFRYPGAIFDMVRSGSALLGLPVDPEGRLKLVADKLCTRIIGFRDLDEGETAGYSQNVWNTATQPTKLGIIPIGYADMVGANTHELGANKLRALAGGVPAEFFGALCMDKSALVLNRNTDVKIGDEVVIFGHQDGRYISPKATADAQGLRFIELFTHITPRVPRIYHCPPEYLFSGAIDRIVTQRYKEELRLSPYPHLESLTHIRASAARFPMLLMLLTKQLAGPMIRSSHHKETLKST